MSVPLATLRRNSAIVWLHELMSLPPAPPRSYGPVGLTAATLFDVRYGKRMDFAHTEAALSWLRHWKTDTGAMGVLRGALQKTEPSAPMFLWSDDQVLDRLARRLAQGAIVVTESLQPPRPSMLPAAPAAAPIVEPPAIAVSALAMPRPPEPPLLPILEEVQIEGAEVLPEILQSLEQVDLTIGEIKLQPISLEPTPSKVPLISDAMTGASTSITETLDKL